MKPSHRIRGAAVVIECDGARNQMKLVDLPVSWNVKCRDAWEQCGGEELE
jgi:hypothetical protein